MTRKFTFLILALLALITSPGWAEVVSKKTYNTPNTANLPSGWSGVGNNTGSYMQLINSSNHITTDNFVQNGFSKIVLKARKYGGPSDTQALITISWYDATTSNETVLGTITPTSTTLTDYTISTPANPTGNTNGHIKIQCKGASSSKGSGVSQVTITYTEGGGSQDTYTVTYDANGGQGTMTDLDSPYAADAEVTLLTNTFTREGFTWSSWEVKDASNNTITVEGGKFTMPASNVTVSAQWTENGGGSGSTTTDILNRELTGITSGTTSYSDWNGKTSNSSAVYAGNSAGGNSSIQLRSTSPSGIVTTTSGGKVKKVEVTWNSNTLDGRTLDVYGKRTAYTYPSDLYSTDTQGTKLGSIVKGTSIVLNISGDYEYIGLRSASGAMYLSEIDITWETGPSISASDVNLAYDDTSGEIPYTITNPVEGQSLVAALTTNDCDWISNVAVDATNSKVTFATTANQTFNSRTATITLTYGEVTKDVTVTQDGMPAPVINLDNSTVNLTYNETTTTIGFSITNPVDNTRLNLSTQCDWIDGFVINAEYFQFTAAVNNSFDSRTAEITVSYQGAESKTVTVTQEGMPAPVINLGSEEVNLAYNETSATIGFSITNPVDGTRLNLSTQCDWIDGFVINAEDFQFTAAVNNSSNSRTAEITVSYQGAESKTVTVNQAVDPSLIPTYTLVTDASTLAVGDIIVIGCSSEGKAAGKLSNDYLSSEDATIASGVLKPEATSDVVEFTLGGSSSAWTLTSSEGTLGAKAEKKLSYSEGTTTWTISIADGAATIASTNTSTNYGRILYNVNSPRFLNYTSSTNTSMLLPEIYKKNQTYSVATPTFSVEAGIYHEAQNVTIACATEGATIYYTTDGSTPNNESTPYNGAINNGAINVSATTTIKAIAYLDGEASAIASATYTINDVLIMFSENGIEGASIYLAPNQPIGTLPTATAVNTPEGFTFVGWTAEDDYYNATTAPELIDATTVPDESTIYNAVYCINEQGTWQLSNSAPVAGDKIIIAGEDEGYYYAFYDAGSCEYIEVNNGIVSNSWTENEESCSAEDYRWIVSSDDYGPNTGLALSNGSNYLHMNNNAFKLSSDLNNGIFEFTASGNGFTMTGKVNSRYLVFNSDEASVWFGISDDQNDASIIYIFKYVGAETENKDYTTSVVFHEDDDVMDDVYGIHIINGHVLCESIIEGKVVVTSNGILDATAGSIANEDASRLVVEDGGQIIFADNDSGAAATILKSITAHGETDGWNFIATPIVDGSAVSAVQNGTYDLYRFNQAADLEWENVKNSEHDFEMLANGQGYLYANDANTTLEFAGTLYNGDGKINLTFADKDNLNNTPSWQGWNLVGNPFTFKAYPSLSYYAMNAEGTAINAETSEAAINPCTAVFVKASATGQSVTFSKDAPDSRSSSLEISLTQANTRSASRIDNAIVSFGEGQQLEKLYMFGDGSSLYIPQGDKEYAVVSAATEGTLPLCFVANKNGLYTLSVNTENVKAEYLHLIDNLTGADTDLLVSNSYTFSAKTSDYASRFKLVFKATVEDEEVSANATFAYINNGDIIVSNEGRATLNVIDMMGRVISSQSINGDCRISTNGLTAGVYVLSLNGMTQKIVVR